MHSSLHLYVEDTDASYERAIAVGANRFARQPINSTVIAAPESILLGIIGIWPRNSAERLLSNTETRSPIIAKENR